jgi:hypothetical protein
MVAQAPLNPWNHYWIIGGSETEVYSSASNTMVPVDDPDYVAWSAAKVAPPIATEAELADVLKVYPLVKPWLFNASSFIQPSVGMYSPDQLKAYSDDARWRKEQGGLVTTAGFPIKTDDRSQAKITGAFNAGQVEPTVVTPWRCADGTVVQLDAAGTHAMNDDLLTHINNCFAISADNYTAIDAGTMTTLEEIDAAYAAPISWARANWLKPKG